MYPGGKCDTFVDWCDWLFETYQHTPRETLLELLAKAEDIEQLRTLEQRDLAIAYSERMAHALDRKATPRSGETTPPTE